MQHNVLDTRFAGNTPDLDVVRSAAKRHGQCRYSFGPGQLVQNPIGRCCDTHLPAFRGQCPRQIAHDVTDAADLATGQGTVLGREEYDLPCNDAAQPILYGEVVARAFRG